MCSSSWGLQGCMGTRGLCLRLRGTVWNLQGYVWGLLGFLGLCPLSSGSPGKEEPALSVGGGEYHPAFPH